MTIKIPKNVDYILYNFERYGYHTFAVGGCVRDAFLGRIPHDWDLCTQALPNTMLNLANTLNTIEEANVNHYRKTGVEYHPKTIKTIPTGIKHGTVTFMIDGEPYEITTFRCDGDYSDCRRPDNVTFTSNINDDLARRDFTINAIAVNPYQGVVDPFKGIDDINNKVIRCVGNPDDRFNEDGLRILRAIRFAAQLGFTIEDETAKSIHKNKDLLDKISKERIQSELFKILNSDFCGNNILREYADIICKCIPQIKPMIGFQQNNPWHSYDVWEHTLHCMEHEIFNDTAKLYPSDINVRLAVLLHDIGKPHCYLEDENHIGHFYGHASTSASITEDILRNLKCSNDIINSVCELVAHHDVEFTPTKSAVKRLLNKLGETQLRRLIVLRLCDIHGQNQNIDNFEERVDKVIKMLSILTEVLMEAECFTLKDLAVNGNDLIEIGIQQGKTIGNVLNSLLSMVIDGEVENEKKKLLSMARLIMTEFKPSRGCGSK